MRAVYLYIVACMYILGLCSGNVFAADHEHLNSIEITDSRGKLSFDSAPKRVVLINWALTEQVLELGIEPVGIADIEGYVKQGGKALPEGFASVDIGSRAAPDLNKIKALKPDIILVGYSQRPLLHQLENLGTVVYFKNFGHRWNNAEKARERYRLLARLLGKTAEAEQRLALSDKNIAGYKQALKAHFADKLPKVTMFVPQGRSNWLFVNNSMPVYAAEALGLLSQTSPKLTKFGVKKLNFADISKPLGCVLVFTDDVQAYDTAAKQALKETSCVAQIKAVNAYGGALSLEYLAKAISEALLK